MYRGKRETRWSVDSELIECLSIVCVTTQTLIAIKEKLYVCTTGSAMDYMVEHISRRGRPQAPWRDRTVDRRCLESEVDEGDIASDHQNIDSVVDRTQSCGTQAFQVSTGGIGAPLRNPIVIE